MYDLLSNEENDDENNDYETMKLDMNADHPLNWEKWDMTDDSNSEAPNFQMTDPRVLPNQGTVSQCHGDNDQIMMINNVRG